MNFIRNFFSKEKKSTQSTFCYCPSCQLELISTGSFVSDEELVTYKCVECQTVSQWLFDAPAPLLLYVNGEEYIHRLNT